MVYFSSNKNKQNMSKRKFIYDPETLSYKQIASSKRNSVLLFIAGIIIGVVGLMSLLSSSRPVIETPREKELVRENENLKLNYELLIKKFDRIETVLKDIKNRDNNIYRTIFEADPISDEIRTAGYGGVDLYKNLEGYTDSDLIAQTTVEADKLEKQLVVQSQSFDEVVKLAKAKEKLLSHIPAIQPVENKDLRRMASGYGWRIHPILKTRRMHYGMDFTAKTGTPIYATGDGVVKHSGYKTNGFGIHVVINHGFGYESLYAHMVRTAVKNGEKIKRGQIIGYVGNTGLSAGPHCHYEVHVNGKKLNPINYYYNDLSPEMYEQLRKMASDENQSLD
jgi:murein DD-endopeptidase MepM/ murein hydrolase activator NlpD